MKIQNSALDWKRRQWLLGTGATLAGWGLPSWPAARPVPPDCPADGAAPLSPRHLADFPGARYRDYARGQPQQLRLLAARVHARREHSLSRLSTPAAIARRQAEIPRQFWQLMGGRPEPTPLHPGRTGILPGPGYSIEKWIYQSRPDFYVTANLYLPPGDAPCPAILFQMGHYFPSKAGGEYQRCAQALAQLGFIVLAFDPIGQGERVCYLRPHGPLSRYRAPTAEHTQMGRQLLLAGRPLTGWMVWDAIRSRDFLAAHPRVDARRLGACGHSGGGTMTMTLLAVEPRIQAAVAANAICENFACAGFLPPGSVDDPEQNLAGAGARGLDRWDLFLPFAPKPLRILLSDMDFFQTYSPHYAASAWEEFQRLRRIYAQSGAADRLGWGDTMMHDFCANSRLQLYHWFRRWLQGETMELAAEPATRPWPAARLWAAPSGSVIRGLGSLTPMEVQARQSPSPPSRPMRSAKLRAALQLPRTRPAPLRPLREVVAGAVRVGVIELQVAEKIWLPAWRFRPASPHRVASTLVVLLPQGREWQSGEGGWFQSIAALGHEICVPDLRGLGCLTPEFAWGPAGYAQSRHTQEAYAWASLILGGPSLLAQRTADILALCGALAARPHAPQLRLAALGELSVPALAAAQLEPRIQAVFLARGLASFAAVMAAADYQAAFTNFDPRLYPATDLPQLAAQLAPRRLWLAGLRDGRDRPLPPSAAQALYPAARILPRGGWSLPRLREFAHLG